MIKQNKWFLIGGGALVALIVGLLVFLTASDWSGITSIKDFLGGTSMIKYVVLAFLTVAFLTAIVILIAKKAKNNTAFNPVERIAIISIFTALSYVLMFFGIPFILPFLKIELSIVVIVGVMLLVDYKTAVLIALLKSTIDYIIKGSAVGYPIDQIAHFTAVLVFLTTIYIITTYFKNKFDAEKRGIKFGLIIGVLTTTVTMLILNTLWILPVYIKLFTSEGFYNYVEMDEPKNFFLWILKIFGPFNLIQWGITAVVSYIIYLRVVLPLRKYISEEKR